MGDNLVRDRMPFDKLDKLTSKMGTAAKVDASLQKMNSESVKKICKGLTGTDLEGCIARNRKGSARRKTRARRRKTRGGACGASDATLSELGLVYMGNCLWQHRDKKAISHIPKGFTKTTLHGKPAYLRRSGGRTTRRR